jgi:gentisate 1,2-dioxygenase
MRRAGKRLGEDGYDDPLVLEVQHEPDDEHEPEQTPQQGPAEGYGVRIGGRLRPAEDSREAQWSPKVGRWGTGLLLARTTRKTRRDSRIFPS